MLVKQELPFNKKQLNSLVYDYLSKKNTVSDFYKYFPDKEGFRNAIASNSFNGIDRNLLKNELLQQSKLVSNTTKQSLSNIELLANGNSFTVTTGHQLCLFTGPLYFVYKIFSVINLCETLKKEFPGHDFVPVYWMASEDHDFEEVNHLNVFGKKIVWQTTQAGTVGAMDTKELEAVCVQFSEILGSTENAKEMVQLFKDSYLNHNNLSDATRYLVNHLFGEYGLVTVDGNSKALKETFMAYFKKDIFENIPFKHAGESIDKLNKLSYNVQVNPREINCFYIENGIRARFEKEGDKYRVIGTEKLLSKQELEALIEAKPESISPNVVLRPCYQQFLLPNIAYVGGPGELAYWLEYKTMFDALQLPFPVLVPRKMIALIDMATKQKMDKFGFDFETVYEEEQSLIKSFLEKSNGTFEIEAHKKVLEQLFSKINEAASIIDKTLGGAVDAEKQKSINSLSAIEQKVNKALKQRSETEINQIKNIKSKLFPNALPQERVDNFSMYYVKWGADFFRSLKDDLNYDLKELGQIFFIEQ